MKAQGFSSESLRFCLFLGLRERVIISLEYIWRKIQSRCLPVKIRIKVRDLPHLKIHYSGEKKARKQDVNDYETWRNH